MGLVRSEHVFPRRGSLDLMPKSLAPPPAAVPAHTAGGARVVVRRSTRRHRTVSASFRDGQAVILIPAHFSHSQEAEWVHRMLARLERGTRTDEPSRGTDAEHELAARAKRLANRYFSAPPVPTSVRWVSNQSTRWGSATPGRGTIRLSNKLQGMPDWVIDYVILHELAHLIVPSHSIAFWRLLKSYPQLERAKAYLEGAAFAGARGLGDQGLSPSSCSESS